MIEKENHVAGNCHTDRDPTTGILKHHFGPHTLHSDNERVWKFIETFTTIHPYAHRKQAWVKGKAYPFPINLETVNHFFGEHLSEDNIAGFLKTRAAPFCTDSPANFEEAALGSLGKELYGRGFSGAIRKSNGARDPKTFRALVFRRLPNPFQKDANVFITSDKDNRATATPGWSRKYSSTTTSI